MRFTTKKGMIIIAAVALSILIVVSGYAIYQHRSDDTTKDYGDTPLENLKNGDPACSQAIAC